MEAKRQRVLDLIRAGASKKEVTEVVECAMSFVYKVLKVQSERGSLERLPRSGRHNLVRTEAFINDVKLKIEADPTISMSCLLYTSPSPRDRG